MEDVTYSRPSAAMFSVALLFSAACSSSGASRQSAASETPEALATVDGAPITESDLEAEGELLQLRQQMHEVKLRAIEAAIARKLLEKEAAKRAVPVEDLVRDEIESKVAEPSDLEIEGFYEQRKSRIGRPLEDVREQIADLLRGLRRQEVHDAFVDGLRAGAEVKVLLDSPRLPVDLAGAPLRGPESAPVTIVEFSDFQCPFCRRIQPTLAELQEKYGDKLRWSFKDLPLLSIHPEAQKSAEAARCAADQGKFWEYRTKMFEAGGLSRRLYDETARELGLDETAFKECLDSDKHFEAVRADLAEAERLGLNGTPAFLINGVLISGAQPLESFTRVIDRELERSGR